MKTTALILLLFLTASCGLVRSIGSSASDVDTKKAQVSISDFKAFEDFSANIPASYIKHITLPSGIEVVLRDTLPDRPPKKTEVDSSSADPAEPLVTFSYESGVEKRDSLDTDVKESVKKSQDKEVEVNSGRGFMWVIVGIAIALAGIIALYLYRPW